MNRNIATALIETLGALKFVTASFRQRSEPKQRKPVPTMVISPPEVIAAWNAAIEARKPLNDPKPSKLHRKAESARQFKRESYLTHEGYAEKHPAIAARYSF